MLDAPRSGIEPTKAHIPSSVMSEKPPLIKDLIFGALKDEEMLTHDFKEVGVVFECVPMPALKDTIWEAVGH